VSKVESINQFLVGDILQICFESAAKKQEWTTFFILRDKEDAARAKEIVETKGGCMYKIIDGYPHGYRSVTPPASLIDRKSVV
jgi:hypothetical protein